MWGLFGCKVPTSHIVSKKTWLPGQKPKALLQGQILLPKTEKVISGPHCIYHPLHVQSRVVGSWLWTSCWDHFRIVFGHPLNHVIATVSEYFPLKSVAVHCALYYIFMVKSGLPGERSLSTFQNDDAFVAENKTHRVPIQCKLFEL